jgi:hypothetical protein
MRFTEDANPGRSVSITTLINRTLMIDSVVEFVHTPCVMLIDNKRVCTLGVDVCTRQYRFFSYVGTPSLSLGDQSRFGRVF